MGAGKSAVGRQLGRLLHLDFMDTDDEIEARTGVDIPFIFEKEGEEGFRKRESRVIDELTSKQAASEPAAQQVMRQLSGWLERASP